MLAFSEPVLEAANNPCLSDAQRYALRRLAEVLGDGVYLTQSAYFVLDPVSATDDLREVLDAYADPQTQLGFHQAIRVVSDTQLWLSSERNGRRFYGARYSALAASLKSCADLLGQFPPSPTHSPGTSQYFGEIQSWRAAQFAARLPTLNSTLDSYRDVAAASAGGYRARLTASIRLQMRRGPSDDRSWRAFDLDLTFLAAALLAQGRHGHAVVEELAEGLLTASSAKDAELRFFDAIRSRARTYEVAFAIDGLRGSNAAPMSGCEFTTASPRWRLGSGTTHASLRSFTRSRRNDRCHTLLTTVTATDPGHARERTIRVAEHLIAELTAANRVSQLLLRREMLVLDVGNAKTTRVGQAPAGLSRPARLQAGRTERLTGPMHYAALARSEPSAVIALVQCWIGLEHLAHGPRQDQPTGVFVPKGINAIVRLTSIRHLLSDSYHLMLRDLAESPPSIRGKGEMLLAWLGGSRASPKFDLERWLTVLRIVGAGDSLWGPETENLHRDAPADDAARFARALLNQLSDYARRRTTASAALVSSPRRLVGWSKSHGDRAAAHADRLRRLRNRIVHDSLASVAGAREGAEVGRQLLDAVFEVLPHWLDSGELPWRGVSAVQDHQVQLFTSWTGAGRPVIANEITRPTRHAGVV